jgi:adenylate cyclase
MYGTLNPIGAGDPISLNKKEIVIGRHKSCDIVLNFHNVSSKHCRLILSDGYWYVLDMQSTNGVKVNGNKVTDHIIKPNSSLAISTHFFVVQYNPQQNGAIGPPPRMQYQDIELLEQSLMEKAGLQKTSSHKKEEEEVPVETDKPVPALPITHRDFFGELQFD